MSTDRYLWLVCSQPNPDTVDEYNAWYNKHVETFFKFPGAKKIVRNKCFLPQQNPDSCPQYVVIYEFESKADLEAFSRSEASEEAKREFMEDWNDCGEFLWSGWYEPVKKLER